jgi:hypothetical protein
LQFQAAKRGGRPPAVQPEFEVVGERVLGSTLWTDEQGRRQERYQVLTIRDGKIVDLQGFTSRRAAERFARRR